MEGGVLLEEGADCKLVQSAGQGHASHGEGRGG